MPAAIPGLRRPPLTVTKLSVKPPSITVDAGSATSFRACLRQPPSTRGWLTWSITPVDGGTITRAGIYTASATAGQYKILATWTPSIPTTAIILKGSATLRILPVPQLDSVIGLDQVQASGANQMSGAIQNGAIVGEGIPAVLAIDSGNIQTRSGFGVSGGMRWLRHVLSIACERRRQKKRVCRATFTSVAGFDSWLRRQSRCPSCRSGAKFLKWRMKAV